MTFDFEIEGTKHSLYFGMAHKEIIENLSIYAVGNGITINDFTGLVFLVHAGRCNYADTKLLGRPEYEDSYAIAEKLVKDVKTVESMYSVWKECEAGKELMAKLPQDNGKKKGVTKEKVATGAK